jgi:hypothetical protein
MPPSHTSANSIKPPSLVSRRDAIALTALGVLSENASAVVASVLMGQKGKSSETPSTQDTRDTLPSLSYTGEFRGLEDIASLRIAQKNARTTSNLSHWKIAFEKPTTPQNSLSLFFNSAPLLERELSKTLPEIVGKGIYELNSTNLPHVLQKLFETTGDERWLSRTRGKITTPLNPEEIASYQSEISSIQQKVTERLNKSDSLRVFVLERFNTLYPQMLIHGRVGRKTLQSLLLGSISTWDTAENARLQSRAPNAVIIPSMSPIDYATAIARLIILTEPADKKAPIVRLQITAPGSSSALTYAIAPFASIERIIGNTLLSHGVTGRDATEHLFAGLRRAIVEMR